MSKGSIPATKTAVCGDTGVIDMSGTLTADCTCRVLHALREHAQLTPDSALFDLGAGIGEPLAHAVLNGYVSTAHGVEIDAAKVKKSTYFLRRLDLGLHVSVTEHNIDTMTALPQGVTHVYLAWMEFPPQTQRYIGHLLSQCLTLRGVAVIQSVIPNVTENEFTRRYGFPAQLSIKEQFPVKLSGGSDHLQAYILGRL